MWKSPFPLLPTLSGTGTSGAGGTKGSVLGWGRRFLPSLSFPLSPLEPPTLDVGDFLVFKGFSLAVLTLVMHWMSVSWSVMGCHAVSICSMSISSKMVEELLLALSLGFLLLWATDAYSLKRMQIKSEFQPLK